MCLPQTPATTFKASPFTSRDVNAGESNQAPLLPNETPVSGVGQGAFEGFFYKIHYDEELMHSSFQSGDAILHEIYNLNLQETAVRRSHHALSHASDRGFPREIVDRSNFQP